MELKRAPETCCPEPGCDKTSCKGCEYPGVCRNDPQKSDYCPRPRTCPSCEADCTKCALWSARTDFSKMTEGEALYSIGARPAEKDGKKGITLHGLFIEASDEKPGAIVAGHNKKHTTRGSKEFRCHDCGRKVWLAPGGQEVHRRYPDVPVICIFCMMKREKRHVG